MIHARGSKDWINEFSQHQSGKKIIIIEVEKDFIESFYYELKDSFKLDFYLNPDEITIDYYISASQNPVIIESKLFYFYHGAELMHVFENVLKNYTINYTKLYSYAKRRDREQEIKQFMSNNTPLLVKKIIE
mgnify:CR=1 FL=1